MICSPLFLPAIFPTILICCEVLPLCDLPYIRTIMILGSLLYMILFAILSCSIAFCIFVLLQVYFIHPYLEFSVLQCSFCYVTRFISYGLLTSFQFLTFCRREIDWMAVCVCVCVWGMSQSPTAIQSLMNITAFNVNDAIGRNSVSYTTLYYSSPLSYPLAPLSLP